MTISLDDPNLDYDGSWADASKAWPKLLFENEERAKAAYVIAWKEIEVPYGSYVLVGNELRVETVEYRNQIEKFIYGY